MIRIMRDVTGGRRRCIFSAVGEERGRGKLLIFRDGLEGREAGAMCEDAVNTIVLEASWDAFAKAIWERTLIYVPQVHSVVQLGNT